ncbi:MAG: amino acid ABC transporter permease, partial [Acidimicrobiales bacterium]
MSDIGLYASEMARGALVTVELTAVGTAVSLVFGAAGALARLHGPRVLRSLVVGYVETIRGLPAILQLFVLYFGLNQFGINLPALWASFIWMCAYGTGYAVEIFRAGLAAVEEGQREAATALGLSPVQSLWRVVIPQAVAVMLPPLVTFVVLELKNTTLVYFVGVHEVMFQARLGASNSGQP